MIRPPPRSPLFPSTPLSRSVGPARLVPRRSRFPRRPRAAADPRLAVGPEGRTEPEQLWLGPSGDHPAAGVAHVDDPVAGDPIDRELRALETLAGERLHGIAPELRDAHPLLPGVGTTRR